VRFGWSPADEQWRSLVLHQVRCDVVFSHGCYARVVVARVSLAQVTCLSSQALTLLLPEARVACGLVLVVIVFGLPLSRQTLTLSAGPQLCCLLRLTLLLCQVQAAVRGQQVCGCCRHVGLAGGVYAPP